MVLTLANSCKCVELETDAVGMNCSRFGRMMVGMTNDFDASVPVVFVVGTMLVVNSLQHPKSFSLSKPLSHLGTMLRPVVVLLLLSLPKLWRLRPSLDDLVMDGEVGGESQLINRSFVDGGAAEVRRCDCCLALLKVKSRKGIAGAWDLTLFIFGGGGLGGPDFLRTSFTFWDDDLETVPVCLVLALNKLGGGGAALTGTFLAFEYAIRKKSLRANQQSNLTPWQPAIFEMIEATHK